MILLLYEMINYISNFMAKTIYFRSKAIVSYKNVSKDFHVNFLLFEIRYKIKV